VINKDTVALAASLQLLSFDAATTAKVWQVVRAPCPRPWPICSLVDTIALTIPPHAM
jgi:hypothetical protein